MGLFDEFVALFSSCEPDELTQSLRDAVSEAETVIQVAENTASFLDASGASGRRLGDARLWLSRISGSIDQTLNICQDIQEVARIKSAIDTLNTPGFIATNPTEAANAFGELFRGFGHFASKLPYPLNTYGVLLTRLGGGFIANVAANIHGDRHEPRIRREIGPTEPNRRTLAQFE